MRGPVQGDAAEEWRSCWSLTGKRCVALSRSAKKSQGNPVGPNGSATVGMSRDIKYIGMDVHQEAIVIAVLDGSRQAGDGVDC